jgi:nicotinate-nucleotide pyrophosphorylase (carboxylating)
MITQENINALAAAALQEDIGGGDITADLIPATQQNEAMIISRQSAIVCGTHFVDAVYQQLNSVNKTLNTTSVVIDWQVKDGAAVAQGQTLCTLRGPARALLSGERSALNFLQTLSSTATLTQQFVTAVAGTKAKILDTRKTLPGMRAAQKYAVTCGGGHNHRFGLYDAVLIKENHIAACGSITQAVNAAAALHPNKTIEVEVTNLKELEEALALPSVDRIMLDNFDLATTATAVALTKNANNTQNKDKRNEDQRSADQIDKDNASEDKKNKNDKTKDRSKARATNVTLEASGGITLENVRAIAATGVDYISVGSLTKNITAIDFSMLFVKHPK